MQSRRSLLVASVYIMLALLLGIVNLVAGIASELPGVSLNVVLTQPVLSNYRVTFLEAVLDFQKFTGDVYGSIIFSLFVAGYCAFNQRPPILPAPERNNPPRMVLLFGILAIGVFVFGILGAVLGWGYNRPYLSDKTLQLLFLNFYPERASELLFQWGILVSGFPALLFIGMKSTKSQEIRGKPNSIGTKMLLIGLAGITVLILAFPIQMPFIWDGDAEIEVIYSITQVFLIVGIIGVMESRQNHDIEPSSHPDPLLRKKVIGHTVAFFGVVIVFGICLIVFTPFVQVGIQRVLQQTLTAVFRITLSLFFYSVAMFAREKTAQKAVQVE